MLYAQLSWLLITASVTTATASSSSSSALSWTTKSNSCCAFAPVASLSSSLSSVNVLSKNRHDKPSRAAFRRTISSTTKLRMGKGFSSAQKKQAELAKKMELGRKSDEREEDMNNNTSNNHDDKKSLSVDDKQQQRRKLEQEQRLEFEQLLKKPSNLPPRVPQNVVTTTTTRKEYTTTSSPVKNNRDNTSNKQQQINARDIKRKRKQLRKASTTTATSLDNDESMNNHNVFALVEGDVARRRDFEHLLVVPTSSSSSSLRKHEQQLGAMGAAQLVPWVPPFLSKYLLVVTDPRIQSNDLRQAMKYLMTSSRIKKKSMVHHEKEYDDDCEALYRIIYIHADSIMEMTKWMERTGLLLDTTTSTLSRGPLEEHIGIYSDPTLQWMKTYSAIVQEERWSMSLICFDDNGALRKLVRQVDPANICQLVKNVVKEMEEESHQND